jgi:NTP pyrophosphatase (non-canonical NTP hydrolase)
VDELQRRVGEWGERTFPTSTDASKLAHLGREYEELREMAEGVAWGVLPAEAMAEEAADVAMLLFHLAHARGFSLAGAIERKFAEVQLRRWLAPDAEGVVEHVRDGGS